MSAHKPRRKNTIWHIEIVTAEAAKAPVAAKLASFAQHKTALLENLSHMYARAPQSASFNGDESWRGAFAWKGVHFGCPQGRSLNAEIDEALT